MDAHSTTRTVRPLLEELESRLTPSVVIGVNATASVHPIDPNIYGAAFATQAQVADLNLTVNRDGGNASDTYNWQVDDTNHASDWYYESISSGSGNGQSADAFVSQTEAGGGQADLTVPIMPYVATLGPGGSDLGSYPVSVYGPQQSTDPYYPNFGNGVTPGGEDILHSNTYDNYAANSPAFEQAWIQHLLTTFGTPGNGGVQFFTLGNEPALWSYTHRDIHPAGETNTELLNDYIAYGSMIKSIDPNAQILGPEEWGWTNYFVDGADSAAGNYGATYPGAGGAKLNVEQWLLQQLDQYQIQNGTRLLDYFTLHYYPQEGVSGDNGGGVDSNNVDQATALLRNQVTRSLWDPNYVDPSWIASTGINGGKVDLIPMMQNWVNTYYPGTKTGITEYNFGAEGDMNGATTQADVYGIFGQQGLDLATRWTTPATGSPTYLAMKLWRNYDGHDSGFGNTSVGTTVPDPDQTDAFAAIRSSDGALTVAVINKNLYNSSNPSATTPVTIDLSNFAASGVSQAWQLAAVNPSNQTNAAITQLSNISFTGNSFTVNVPMESVTMFVIEPATQTVPKVTANPSNETVSIGQLASFMASASGTPAPSVQWQMKSSAAGATFTNIPGATATTYSFTASSNQNGYQYQAVFTNANGTATSSPATLTLTQDSTGTSAVSPAATNANPSQYGQSLTFTASVTNTAGVTGVPAGTVTFYNGSTSMGTRTLEAGIATLTLTSLSVGSYAITASYNGLGNFAPSSSPAGSAFWQTVIKIATNTSAVTPASTNPANPTYGQPLTFSATVTNPTSAGGTPTGSVTFYNGTTALGTRALSAGTATITVTALPAGTATITAKYLGAGNFASSSSPTPLAQTIAPAPTATSVVKAAATNPANPLYGQSLTFTASVSNASGGGTPTGTVTFHNGSTALGTRTLVGGVATITLANLPGGTAMITATYGGTSNYSSSVSPSALAVTVGAASTGTSVAASPSPATLNELVTLSATVSNTAGTGTTPSGTVTFKDVINGVTTTLGTRSLVNGVATFTTSSLASGSHTIEAFFSLNSDYLASFGEVLETVV